MDVITIILIVSVVLVIALIAGYLYFVKVKKKMEQLVIEQQQSKGTLWNILNSQILELNKEGKYDAAIKVAEDGVRVAKRTFGENDPRYAGAITNLAAMYKTYGNFEEAEKFYLEAKSIFEAKMGKDNPTMASVLNNLADLYSTQRMFEKAEPFYNEAVRLLEGANDYINLSTVLENMAVMYRNTGRELLAKEAERKIKHLKQ